MSGRITLLQNFYLKILNQIAKLYMISLRAILTTLIVLKLPLLVRLVANAYIAQASSAVIKLNKGFLFLILLGLIELWFLQ